MGVNRRNERLGFAVAFGLIAAWAMQAGAQDAKEWGYYSANKETTRYSPLSQIDAANVSQLKIVWRHPQLSKT